MIGFQEVAQTATDAGSFPWAEIVTAVVAAVGGWLAKKLHISRNK